MNAARTSPCDLPGRRVAGTLRRHFSLALLTVMAIATAARAQAPPPGPPPALTEQHAIAHLKAVHVIPKGMPVSPTAFITGREFAELLLRAVDINIPAALNRPPRSPTTAALAAEAVNKLHLAAGAMSFARPARPITREDAVMIALNAAARTGHLRPGAMPKQYPRFQDESAFSNWRTRAAAHEAVMAGLVRVGPDNKFNPTAPLRFGEAAQLVARIRAAPSSRRKE